MFSLEQWMNNLHCHHCGEVIGVYEPLVAIVDGEVRETSRLRSPELAAGAGEYFHAGCYERLEEGSAGGWTEARRRAV
jgi:hypothetical protein